MKNLTNIPKLLIAVSFIFILGSCKKDKSTDKEGTSGTFEYQGKSYNISDADYREGNGDGAWIYLGSKEFNFVQIRTKNLGNYVIPTGTFTYKSGLPYDPAKNFAGGFADISNVSDEINGGTVVISKDGEKYTISVNSTTAKGTLKANFTGTLKKYRHYLMKTLKHPCQILFLLLIAAGTFFSCKKNKDGLPANTCGLPELKMVSSADVPHPCGLAVSSNGRVATTEYKEPYGSTGITRIWNSYTDLLTGKAPGQTFQSVGAEAIAFDHEENLYVTETEQNARIVIYKKNIVNGASTYQYWKVIQEGFINPRGIAFDSHNRLYLADDGKDRLLRFDDPLNSSTANVVAGVFGSPKGISITNDTLYITGYSTNRLYKCELTAAGGLGKIAILNTEKPVDVAAYQNIVAIAHPGSSKITLLNANQIQKSEVTYSGCFKELTGSGPLYGMAFVKTPGGYGLLTTHYNQNKVIFYEP